ncbi:acyl-CoA synthetase (AMP-forming)/AMP-acid ligase II/pimeloyl-ACP methyl ester carboxylesterase [Nakamurella flavida]|uniref:alpha/beta fold hydrolase n=1 Tax=Nakamurella flavida TaxID=363630 RepID=UPI002787EDFB|nr:alpha/beta fold hydrolase [Nakamurella flavida]MDP9779146.1 acyl-CoA synthetase (AMP-forming)/AMP-acid ligase II/pimeloyl-ACP methyl ester carboxylesterase [Nakamurella flavida]
MIGHLRARSASRPPAGLPGLDPAWSRLVRARVGDGSDGGAKGAERTFHVLDSWADRPVPDVPEVTLLCVHGNPTWSYLWRRLVEQAPSTWRVVAPDQLGMGWSERLDGPRVLADRVADLGALTEALRLRGPVVTVAHDWGGIVSLGWAREHPELLAGVVLTNTAVHQPGTSAGPPLIRLAHVPAVNAVACVATPLFVRATTSLVRPWAPKDVRDAFAAPYRSPAQRAAVGEFVADVPFAADHPSRPTLDVIAEGTRDLDVPALLLWGPKDPVFREEHLRDLLDRLPQAQLHRFETAGHLLAEDAPQYVDATVSWVSGLLDGAPEIPAALPSDAPSVFDRLEARREDDEPAVTEVGGRSITWRELHTRVTRIAAGLRGHGLRTGDRVALLVPPSIELTVALYAVWRAGGVVVVADKGLGLRGMARALRSARIDHLIADTPGLLAAAPMGLPGTRISVREPSGVVRRAGSVSWTLPGLEHYGDLHPVDPIEPELDAEAAVLFTSGATGPAKGVLYRHRQLRAQLALIRSTYGLTADDRMVAAFAPFALYGPALGVRSAVPATDVTKPGSLTARALGDAARAIDATVVFASPAALRNVLATAELANRRQRHALARVRLLMSAGAPVPADVLHALADLLPHADPHTPYGMTEALPVADISLAGIDAAGRGDGVCVGHPLAGVQVRITPLDADGVSTTELTDRPGITGEIWVRAAHVKDSYDALWFTDQLAAAHPGWHRTGDVGMLDEQGRLWVQGRFVHVITGPDGPVTPVGIEQRVELEVGDEGTPAAVVGVGPAGTQQVVVVLSGPGELRVGTGLANRVRAAAGVPVAAVLRRESLPVDIRHNSKIDRSALARWAADELAGG